MKSKKQLKEAYKQYRPTMGVFQIKNKINHKVLIEGSTNVNALWNRYQMELKFGSHRNKDFQKDWKEFKAENFSFEILSELKYDEEKNLDYGKEVKLLQEMVVEEMNISKEMQY